MYWSKVLPNLNNAKLGIVIAAIGWVFAVVFALYLAYQQQTQVFDPDNKMAQTDWLQSFHATMGIKSKGIELTHADTLYIVDENSCVCSTRSQPHIQSLSEYALNNGIHVVNLTPTPALARLLPAQPAAILVSKEQQLVYAGPLSKGLACSSQNGFVELVIANLRAGFNSRFINSDAKGCYCQIS